MSVTLAPRARISVNASWPGVSRNTMLRSLTVHVIGADVLRDAAGFALGDARFADGVEQRGLAVVDVAHDRDDRRARDDVLGLRRPRPRPASSSSSKLRISTSAPNSRAIIVAVSVSSVLLMVIISRFISSLRARPSRTSSLSARSLTVMPSASVMVRVTGGGAAGIGACVGAVRRAAIAARPPDERRTGRPRRRRTIARHVPGRGGCGGRTGCDGSGRGPPSGDCGAADTRRRGGGPPRPRRPAGRTGPAGGGAGRLRLPVAAGGGVRRRAADATQQRPARRRGRRLAGRRIFDAQPQRRRHEAARCAAWPRRGGGGRRRGRRRRRRGLGGSAARRRRLRRDRLGAAAAATGARLVDDRRPAAGDGSATGGGSTTARLGLDDGSGAAGGASTAVGSGRLGDDGSGSGRRLGRRPAGLAVFTRRGGGSTGAAGFGGSGGFFGRAPSCRP